MNKVEIKFYFAVLNVSIVMQSGAKNQNMHSQIIIKWVHLAEIYN